MKSYVLSISLVLGGFSHEALSAPDMKSLRQAEKIALTLTGKPLSNELRKSFMAGTASLDQIAEQLSKDPAFIEHYAMFWARTLGFTLPFNAYELREAGTNQSFGSINFRQYSEGFYTQYAASYTQEDMARKAKAMSGALQLSLRDCPAGPLLFVSSNPESAANVKKAATEGIGPDGNPILPGTETYWKEILPIYEKGDLPCDAPGLKEVNPWWDPEQVSIDSRYMGVKSYLITPLAFEHCGGGDLKACNTNSLRRHDRYTDTFNKDLLLEPAYLIAHTVAEDRSFGEVVTSPETIMTGSYGAWMATNGQKLWANYPGGAIDDANHAIFKSPKPTDRTHYRIKRNAMHAGVLSTPAFQLLTNGRRAKANKVYETFLCRKFVVPDGAQPNPADSNPDLTKRAYCKYCHKSLEPMAAFFNKWPTTGVNNFIFDNKSGDINETGRFNGETGVGVAGFGKIVAEAEPFAECAVKRSFEFVNGRKMSVEEAKDVLALSDKLKASDFNVRLIIKAMLLSPSFLTREEK